VARALTPAPYLRRVFTIGQPVTSARLYVTALGLYEARLNGRRVGDGFLTPGWTDYTQRVAYQTYDVTGLLNQGDNANHRVLFKLVGTKSNKAAIGARVTIRAAGVTQFDEVRGGGSYLSQNDLRIHFGLGAAAKIDVVDVRWPNGKVESMKDVAADKIYTIIEGQGIKGAVSFDNPPR